MTRRIAIFIFLTVLAILIAAGTTTYVVARATLLASLDESIAMRAASRPQIIDASGNRFSSVSPVREDDRFLVRNEIGQTLARSQPAPSTAVAPQVMSAIFSNNPDGTRSRVVTFRAYAHPVVENVAGDVTPSNAVVPVTLTFRGSAQDFDSLMSRLAWILSTSGMGGGALAAGLAWIVARASLRPLQHTAEAIGSIDESALGHRISTSNLPDELRPVGDRLNDMLARLETSFARRKRFLADAAHELRTPVAAMTTGIEVVLRRPRDASIYRETLATCLSEVRLMRALVESLMTQARAELAAFDEPLEDVSLRPAIEQVVQSLRPLADERSVALTFDVSSELNVRASENRLRSVIMNLVANAIEHNRAGGSVDVNATRVGSTTNGSPHVAMIRVRDTGPGIAESHLPHLFEPFYRADASRDEREAKQHLGLGLFLVKTHLSAMGGTCDVESRPGEGTTFILRLPLAAANAAPVGGGDVSLARSAGVANFVSQPFHAISAQIADNSVENRAGAVG